MMTDNKSSEKQTHLAVAAAVAVGTDHPAAVGNLPTPLVEGSGKRAQWVTLSVSDAQPAGQNTEVKQQGGNANGGNRNKKWKNPAAGGQNKGPQKGNSGGGGSEALQKAAVAAIQQLQGEVDALREVKRSKQEMEKDAKAAEARAREDERIAREKKIADEAAAARADEERRKQARLDTIFKSSPIERKLPRAWHWWWIAGLCLLAMVLYTPILAVALMATVHGGLAVGLAVVVSPVCLLGWPFLLVQDQCWRIFKYYFSYVPFQVVEEVGARRKVAVDTDTRPIIRQNEELLPHTVETVVLYDHAGRRSRKTVDLGLFCELYNYHSLGGDQSAVFSRINRDKLINQRSLTVLTEMTRPPAEQAGANAYELALHLAHLDLRARAASGLGAANL